MKRKITAFLASVIILSALFGACGVNENAEAVSRPDLAENTVLSSASQPSSTASEVPSSVPPSASESKPEPEPVAENETVYEGPLPPEAFEGVEPLPPADNLNAESTKIVVKLETYADITNEVNVTESGMKDKIIACIGGIKPANYSSLGQLGGVVFHLEATKDGVTEAFVLFGITDDKGNPLVKRPKDPDRWYMAEPELWEYAKSLFPELDYTGVTSVDLWHYSEYSGIGFDDRHDKAIVDKIKNYLDSMKAAKIEADVSNANPIRVSIGLVDGKEDKWYHCYDLYDKSGKCLVKYEGIRTLEKIDGKIEPVMDASGAGWFLADADFYRYLDSFIYHSDSDIPVEE